MTESNKGVEEKIKLLQRIEQDSIKSTPTSPINARWRFHTKFVTLKNSSSEPNVCIKDDEKTEEGNNSKRNSKSEDCLLDLDSVDSPLKSTYSTESKSQFDDIFTRALKERLGIKSEVVSPGRVMVLNEGSGGAVASQGGTGDGGGIIAPRRLINPCLESMPRQDLHRELMFNQKIGKNVLNQKSELEKALSRHKERQNINQGKEKKETPELERAIAERAKRLEESMNGKNIDKLEESGCNPQYIEARARLRHAK